MENHNFIRWWFPMEDEMGENEIDILEFKSTMAEDSKVIQNVRLLANAMLRYFGLACALRPNGSVQSIHSFDPATTRAQIGRANHCCARVTRMLRCMGLLGISDMRDALWRCLKDLKARDRLFQPTFESYVYWMDAMDDKEEQAALYHDTAARGAWAPGQAPSQIAIWPPAWIQHRRSQGQLI